MAGRIILIAGPTASGKSAIAIALAKAINGVVINADSMQVYADLRVLTARPSLAEEQLVPHALFGHVDGAVNYSTGLWLADVEHALLAAQVAGQVAILCGGTGLYFKTLTQGLSAIPAVPPEIRARVRAEAQGHRAGALHARLAACDPETAAGLRPSDPQRILRALEVYAATGRPLVSFQGQRATPRIGPHESLRYFINPEKSALHSRIAARFAAMLQDGALAEARALMARRLDPALPVMRAHGAPHLMAYARGEISLEAATERACVDTRQYTRRQFTFGRNQLSEFVKVAPEVAVEQIFKDWRRSQLLE